MSACDTVSVYVWVSMFAILHLWATPRVYNITILTHRHRTHVTLTHVTLTHAHAQYCKYNIVVKSISKPKPKHYVCDDDVLELVCIISVYDLESISHSQTQFRQRHSVPNPLITDSPRRSSPFVTAKNTKPFYTAAIFQACLLTQVSLCKLQCLFFSGNHHNS